METENKLIVQNTDLSSVTEPDNPATTPNEDIEISPSVNEYEHSLVRMNRMFTPAVKCEKADFFKALNHIINTCHKELRYNYTDGDLTDISLTLCDDVYRYFPNATIPELDEALHLGIRGEYKSEVSDFNLSAPTLFKYIKCFYNLQYNTQRKDALAKQRRFEEEEDRKRAAYVPTELEQDVIIYFTMLKMIKALEVDEDAFIDAKDTVYKKLRSLNVLPEPTEEQIVKYAQKAKDNIKLRYERDAAKSKEKSIKDNIKEQVRLLMVGHASKDGKIMSESRRLYLKDFMKDFLDDQKRKEFKHKIRMLLFPNVENDKLVYLALKLKTIKVEEAFDSVEKFNAFKERIKKYEQ